MLCRIAPLAMPIVVGSVAVGQDKNAASQQSKPANPDVLVIKAPEPPKDQPQPFVPALKAVDLEKRPKLSEGTKMQLIQVMDAELVHVRKYMPLGDKSIVITPEGTVKPGDAQLFQMTQGSGAAAKIGDKVQITNVIFHDKAVTFEINGGPKKKSKWYQHITISGMGGSTQQDPNQAQPTGAAMTLQFNKYVPEMNGEELKKLVSPVLDFSVKSAAEVYEETLPPKIRDAIKAHEVLVGMNKDMVVMAKDRPPQKVREKDEAGKEYEEWIYGKPPQDVVFVRFKGDEVTRVKIAKIGGEMIVKTEKEVDVRDGVATLASLQASSSPQDVKQQQGPQPQQPAKRPTLKRPDEAPDPDLQQRRPSVDNPQRDDDPQWGEKKKPDDGQEQSTQQQKPPL